MPSPKENNSVSVPSDNQLVQSAQSGDEAALAALLVRYTPMVRAIASRSFGTSLETDDLAQEGMLGLVAAVYAYMPEREASFRTFASVCAENRVSSAIRAASRLKHQPLNSYVPLSDVNLVSGNNPEDVLLAQEKVGNLLSFLSADLSEKERNVLRAYLTQGDYKSIAEQLGITVKSVDNTLQRVRSKLKIGLRNWS